ncbi:hypothetical protein AWZ03_013524 [Drosophila navojoa]|uniref:Uncharacterized protein n=1 Tax=Drosophila navojoa TaxID=7232 RepID=A0A484AVJ1_DRONA|nr:hypothetical protein AWZ03_013524 [Drosophila navojoa]
MHFLAIRRMREFKFEFEFDCDRECVLPLRALSALALVLALRVLVSLLVEPEIVILAAALDGLTPLHHPNFASS